MFIIKGDKIVEDSPLFYILVLLSMVGTYDIIGEILDNNTSVFSQNFMKKIIVWCAVYSQTRSIYYASIISICIVLLFPYIFFGKQTSSRLKKNTN